MRGGFIKTLLWLFLAAFGFICAQAVVTGENRVCARRGGNCRTYLWPQDGIEFVWSVLPFLATALIVGLTLFLIYRSERRPVPPPDKAP